MAGRSFAGNDSRHPGLTRHSVNQTTFTSNVVIRISRSERDTWRFGRLATCSGPLDRVVGLRIGPAPGRASVRRRAGVRAQVRLYARSGYGETAMIEKLAIVKKAAAAKRLLVVPALLGAGLLATGLVSLLAVSLIGYEQTHGAAATDRSKADAVVDASPGTIAAYRKDGHFPDGSVLVKEVFESETGAMTTGTVSHARTLQGWFVMVKDRNNSHPDNPLWGDGWGWSWFDAANPSETTSTDYGADCKGCHVPAEATEWVYVEGYPPLKR